MKPLSGWLGTAPGRPATRDAVGRWGRVRACDNALNGTGSDESEEEQATGNERAVIDVGDMPELSRLVEEVQATRESRIPRRNGQDLAVLMPMQPPAKRRQRPKTEAQLAAFRSAAGGWGDVDTDKLIAGIYADRDNGSERLPIER
jgi:hypothetical protein